MADAFSGWKGRGDLVHALQTSVELGVMMTYGLGYGQNILDTRKWVSRKQKMNRQYFYTGFIWDQDENRHHSFSFCLLKHTPFCITYDSCCCKNTGTVEWAVGGHCCYLLSQQLRIIHGMIQWTNITSWFSSEQHKVKVRTAALTFPYPQRQMNH